MDEHVSETTAHAEPATETVAVDVNETERAHIVRSTGVTHGPSAGRTLEGRGITWMRISDAVAAGSGKVAGRGLSLEAELRRRMRHPAAVTRRAIRERTHRLPPLSEFGAGRRVRSIERGAMDRR